MATERLILEVRVAGTSKAVRSFDQMGAAAKRTTKNVNLLKGAVAQLRTLLVITASARVLGGLASVLVDFEDSLGTVRGVTGATTAEFEALRAKTAELGETTRFTAAQVADGATALARAGLNAGQVLGTLDQQLLLARVGNLELADAADIATNVLLGFGLETKDLADVVDDLAFTANRSNTTVQQLGQAFKFVAPLASATGLQVGETSAALGVLAQQGIRADVAGTGVARVLARLEAPSTKLQKALGALNIDLEDVKPSAVGFRAALQTLSESGLSAGAIIELLGDRAGRTAVAILQNLNLFDKFNTELDENQNFAKDTAEEMRNLKDDVLEVVSAFQAIILRAGELGGTTALSNFLNGLRDGFRFIAANLPNIIQGFKTFALIFTGGLLIKGILGFVTAIKAGTLATNGLIKRLAALKIALLTNPITFFAAAVGLVIGSLVAFQDQIELVEGSGVTLGDTFRGIGAVFGDTVTAAVNSLGFEFEGLGDIFASVLSFLARGFTAIVAGINGAINAIEAILDNFGAVWELTWKSIINSGIQIIEDFQNSVGGFLNSLLEAVGSDLRIPQATLDQFDISDEAKNAGKEVAFAYQEGVNEVFLAINTANQERLFPSTEDLPEPDAPPERTTLGDVTTQELLGGADAANEAADAFKSLIEQVSPLVAGYREASDVFNTLRDNVDKMNAITEQFGITADDVINRTAREIVGLSNAEAELADRLKLVEVLLTKTAISAEEAALAQRKLRIEAQGTFLSGLGGAFPLLDATQKLEEQTLFLDENQERLKASGIDYAEAQKRMARESFGLGQTVEQLNEQQEALIKNQQLLGLSSGELEDELRRLNIQFLQNQRDAGSGAQLALERYVDDVTNAAAFTEMVFSDAFKGIEDAIVGFVETGKFQIDDLFRNFAAQLIRLGAQQATAGFGSAIGGLFGGGAAGSPGATGQAGGGFGGLIASAAGSFFGFQNGGSFTVGANTALQGIPGIDNRLIAFRARDGEEVQVTPRGGNGPTAPINQVFNIQTRDADSFRRSQTQLQNRALAGINQARRSR